MTRLWRKDKPDEDPFGWGGDLSQHYQDMLDQELPSSPDRPNGPADADMYPNLLPNHVMEDPKTSGCVTKTPDVRDSAAEQTSQFRGHAVPKPCIVENERDVIFDNGAAVSCDGIATSPDPTTRIIRSRVTSRSPRRYFGEESFGLTTVHLSHQFGFRDFTLWCWRCGGWSVGSRRISRLQGPCGAPTKNGADVVYRVSGGLPPKALHWRSDDTSRTPERIPIIKNPYSNRFRPQVSSQVDSPA